MNEPGSGQSPSTSYSSISVLVVDDNPANREAFESVIRPLGYSLSMAASGKQALDLALRTKFAVILLDVRMPIMNGLETAVELRRMPFSRGTPIIFVSAYEETQLEVSRTGIAGMTDFIFSPVNPEVLTWKVHTWVEFALQHEMLKRQAARAAEGYEALHELLEKTPVPFTETKEANQRLGNALRGLVQALSGRESAAV